MASTSRRSRSAQVEQERRPRWRIEDVLARSDLASLLDELAQPATFATRGRRWHCPVPEHEDVNASVTMHIDRHGHERWRCWSGDNTHRGDAIDLVTVTQRVDKTEAIDWLAQRAGMTPDRPLPPPQPRKPAPTRTVVPLDPAVTRYAAACEKILWQPAGQPVREWLATRGVTPEIVRANHIGADPGRRMLARTRGLPSGASVAATFPALDQAGTVRYLQARYLNPTTDGPKYDNPAARLGTNPRLAWTATVGTPQPGLLIVCEGIPDALTAAQAGYRAVAILGAQAPDTAVAARLATRAEQDQLTLVAVADNDPAGHRWAEHLHELLTDHGHEPTVITPETEGADLNDWAREDSTWHRPLDTLTLPHVPEPAHDPHEPTPQITTETEAGIETPTV